MTNIPTGDICLIASTQRHPDTVACSRGCFQKPLKRIFLSRIAIMQLFRARGWFTMEPSFRHCFDGAYSK